MQVGKWGNSLAVRLPAAVVEALGLKEGDEIEIEIAGDRTLRVERDRELAPVVVRLKRDGLPEALERRCGLRSGSGAQSREDGAQTHGWGPPRRLGRTPGTRRARGSAARNRRG